MTDISPTSSIVEAHGIVRHIFDDDYCGAIGLTFNDSLDAHNALKTLGNGWKFTDSNMLLWVGGSDEFVEMKARFRQWNLRINPCGFSHCITQCKNAAIDSIPHQGLQTAQVIFGPQFMIDIPFIKIKL